MTRNKIIIVRNAASYDFGGGERFPVFLAEALQELNREVLLVSRSKKLLDFANGRHIPTTKGWWWSKQQWSGMQILLSPLYFIWQLILFVYYLALFIEHSPKVVHLQSKDDFIAGTLAARLTGTRVIWTDHADLKHIWQNLSVWYKNPIGKAVWFAARYAHSITVVSKSEENLVTRQLPADSQVRDKITVIYNGVIDQIDRYPHEDSKEAIRFIVASRLVVDKGIREVVAAFDKLHFINSSVSLTILGDGPDSKDMKSLPGAEHVTFLGHVEDPLKYLARADIFIHPTYHEGFSVALVEACMMSLAIIATDVGGNPEIIHHQESGLLVKPRDVNDLYEAMRELSGSEKLRHQYAKNARLLYTKNFEFTKIILNSFLPLYNGDRS